MADLLLNIKIRATKDGKGLAQFKEDLRGLTKEAKRFGVLGTTSFRSAKRELEGLARANKRLGKSIGGGAGRGGAGGSESLGGSLRETNERREDLARGLSDLGRTAERALSGPLRTANTYETRLANIRTLTDEASFSTEDLRRITQEASAEFGGTSADQAGALYDIISSGAKDAAEAQGTLVAANKLSIGGLTDVATATSALSATTANFTKQGVDSERAADLLFSVVRKGRTTLDQTAKAFPGVASAAGGIGLQAEQAAGAFAQLTLTTKSSAKAATQFEALISATEKPTQQAEKALRKLNREREKLGKEAIQIDTSAIRELGVAGFAAQFQGVDDNTLARIFGSKNARAAVVAFRDNIDGLNSAIEAAKNSTGDAGRAFKIQSETQAQRLARLNAQLDAARLAIGEAVAPVIAEVTPSLVELAKVAGNVAKNNPGLVKAGGLLGIAAVGAGRLADTIVSVNRAARIAGPLLGKAGGLIGKLAGKVGPRGALGLALGGLTALIVGEFAPSLIGATESLSDKLGRELARIQGFSQEEKVGQRQSAAALAAELRVGGRKVLRGGDGKEITDRETRLQLASKRERELRAQGVGENTISQTLLNEGFKAAEFGVARNQAALREARGGGVQGQLDVRVKVDRQGNVIGADGDDRRTQGIVASSTGAL